MAKALGRAYATGLLSIDTLSARIGRAHRARDVTELDALVADLPPRVARPGGIRTRLRRLIDWVAGGGPDGPSGALGPLVALPEPVRGGRALLVGRSRACDVVLSDPTVSRRHAELRRHSTGWIVCDLCSTNGTWVNGTRVGRAPIHPGDAISLGHARITVGSP
jgi:hypothetical protein